MKASTTIKDEAPYSWGSLGGRGFHPADPTGAVFGPTHWPQPQPHERGKAAMRYMIIDITTVEGIAVPFIAPNIQVASLIERLRKANGEVILSAPLEKRSLSALEPLQLQYLFWNLHHEAPPADYVDVLAGVFETIGAMAVNAPSLAELEAETARVCPFSADPLPPASKRPVAVPLDRPKAQTTTGRVWESADAITGDGPIDRKAIIAACEADGINAATAATQFSKWKNARPAKATQ